MLIDASKIIDQGIRPHAAELSAIMVTNDVACVVFEPSTTMVQSCLKLGWDGESPVFRLDSSVQTKLATSLRNKYPICSNWLLRSGYGRILVIYRDGTLLLNHDIVNGFFYLEEPSHAQSSELLN